MMTVPPKCVPSRKQGRYCTIWSLRRRDRWFWLVNNVFALGLDNPLDLVAAQIAPAAGGEKSPKILKSKWSADTLLTAAPRPTLSTSTSDSACSVMMSPRPLSLTLMTKSSSTMFHLPYPRPQPKLTSTAAYAPASPLSTSAWPTTAPFLFRNSGLA
ncbi:hypothetical protein D9613_012782 [Agrocybe pediades]|uniref:Uncharacterized protein n=1 Tax=Agrocybe pediades TaxID=84607 RepID=A0A8H4R1J8_9AGAR|nr:hypothetical protein D9613_012782 [Agrocybe pediades]